MYEPNKGLMSGGALAAADCLSHQSTAARGGATKPHNAHQPASTRRRTHTRFAATVSALAVMAGWLGMGPDASAQSAAQANAPRGAATSFQGQAAQLGVKSCANLFAGLGNILAHGATYTSEAHVGKDSPADPTAQAVVGMQYDTPAYKAQAAGVVFTAPTKSGCEGQLVRVAPFPQSCPDVVRLLPQGSALTTTLSGTPLYTLGGNQGQALLVSSGNSCVVVTVASAMERR